MLEIGADVRVMRFGAQGRHIEGRTDVTVTRLRELCLLVNPRKAEPVYRVPPFGTGHDADRFCELGAMDRTLLCLAALGWRNAYRLPPYACPILWRLGCRIIGGFGCRAALISLP
jgi:hypothetical protein